MATAVQETIEERVKRGMAFLDLTEPGWEHKIELRRLQLDSGCNCILGQLHGGYVDGARIYGRGEARNFDAEAKECGFLAFVPSFIPGGEYGLLTNEWKRAIAERRGDDAIDNR